MVSGRRAGVAGRWLARGPCGLGLGRLRGALVPPAATGEGRDRGAGSGPGVGAGGDRRAGLGGQDPRGGVPGRCKDLCVEEARAPFALGGRVWRRGRPEGWKSEVTRRARPSPCLAPGPLVGVRRQRGALATRLCAPGGCGRSRAAWAARPPALRDTAGSGAVCRAGGGGAESSGGEKPRRAGVRERAPGGRERPGALGGLGGRSLRPGRTTAALRVLTRTRCARGSPALCGVWLGPRYSPATCVPLGTGVHL